MDILQNLNQQQKQAVLATKGPVLVLAGAGSGKTRVIIHRIAYLIQQGVKPDKILAVTFTNKAAEEMKKRINKILPRSFLASAPFISTFHSLGVYILKNSGRYLKIPKNFSILDEEDSLGLIKACLKELNLNPQQFQPSKVRALISHYKNRQTDSQELLQLQKKEFFLKTIGKIWEKYEQTQKKQKALDFDDLIIKTVSLFQEHTQALEYYQDKWPYIHIDEYQDTNHSQYLLANLLAKKHQNICAVGDDDQSIYSFRGADYRNILNFEKTWPKAKIISLEENYRSTLPILKAANAVINKNKARRIKNLFTQKKQGEPLFLFNALDETEESRFVASQIKELKNQGQKLSSIAILYRTNFQSRILEEELLKHSLAYQVLGTRFYERKEVKDIISYIKSALNPDDLLSIKRIINLPARGIGKVTFLKFLEKSQNLSAKEKEKISSFQNLLGSIKEIIQKNPSSKAIRLIMEKTGYQKFLADNTEEGMMRLGNLKELVSLAKKYDNLKPGQGLEALLTEVALASDQDSLKNQKKGVRLMTVHAAKGLEFDNVFLTGLEQGLFPINNSLADLEEERRLFYVALTRAKNNIFLSFANFRTIFGDKKINLASNFLLDIPEELLKLSEPDTNTQIHRE